MLFNCRLTTILVSVATWLVSLASAQTVNISYNDGETEASISFRPQPFDPANPLASADIADIDQTQGSPFDLVVTNGNRAEGDGVEMRAITAADDQIELTLVDFESVLRTNELSSTPTIGHSGIFQGTGEQFVGFITPALGGLGWFRVEYFAGGDFVLSEGRYSTGGEDLRVGSTARVGDADLDGDIDVQDLNLYRGNLGQPTSVNPNLDLNNDGTITLADHDLHVTQYLPTPLGMGTAIGDINLDGRVDVLKDAATLVENLNRPGPFEYSDGDLNADGVVDVLNDAARLVENLRPSTGSSASLGASLRSVPEPASATPLTLMTSFLLNVRRRTR